MEPGTLVGPRALAAFLMRPLALRLETHRQMVEGTYRRKDQKYVPHRQQQAPEPTLVASVPQTAQTLSLASTLDPPGLLEFLVQCLPQSRKPRFLG